MNRSYYMIRKQYLKNSAIKLLIFCFCIVCSIAFFIVELKSGNVDTNDYIIGAAIVVLSIILGISLIDDFEMIINPKKNIIFEIYEEVEKVEKMLNELYGEPLYKDGDLIISKNYIFNGNIESLVKIKEIKKIATVERYVNNHYTGLILELSDCNGRIIKVVDTNYKNKGMLLYNMLKLRVESKDNKTFSLGDFERLKELASLEYKYNKREGNYLKWVIIITILICSVISIVCLIYYGAI